METANNDIDSQVSFILHDKIGIKINFNSKELGCESFTLKGNKVTHVDLELFEKLKKNKFFSDLISSGKIEILLEPESEESRKRGRPKKQELA